MPKHGERRAMEHPDRSGQPQEIVGNPYNRPRYVPGRKDPNAASIGTVAMVEFQQPKVSEVMTEAALQRSIVAAARDCGWLVQFAWSSMHSPSGFPDLVLCNPERYELLFWECKSAKGKVSEAQQVWLDALGKIVNVEARVVRPADLEWCYQRLVTHRGVDVARALGEKP